MQIAAFAYPAVVLAGLLLGVGVTMALPTFLLAALLASTVAVHFVAASGRVNYLAGAALLTAYALFAVTTMFIRDGVAHAPSP